MEVGVDHCSMTWIFVGSVETVENYVTTDHLVFPVHNVRHKDLLNLFNRTESSIRLLRLQKRMAKFNNIATQVEILAKRFLCGIFFICLLQLGDNISALQEVIVLSFGPNEVFVSRSNPD
jgi:hypothetical protein